MFKVIMTVDNQEYVYGEYENRDKANEVAMEVRNRRKIWVRVVEAEWRKIKVIAKWTRSNFKGCYIWEKGLSFKRMAKPIIENKNIKIKKKFKKTLDK